MQELFLDEFKFRGHTYTYGQYLDHEGQREITCVDTKKMAFIFTDGESEAFADSKGYDIHGWGDNVPDDETWVRESGEYIRSKIIGVLELDHLCGLILVGYLYIWSIICYQRRQ